MMDTPDRPDDPLPVRRSPVLPLPPVSPHYDAGGGDGAYGYHDGASAGGKKVSAGLVWRALRRHWWQALLLWTVGTAGLMTLAYFKVKPTFDASARILVESGDLSIHTQGGTNNVLDFDQYMQTQVKIVTDPNTLGTALSTHPELTTLPLLRDSADAERELEHALRVGQEKGTNLIVVQMSSQSRDEAATIVNAVVDAFLKNALYTHETSNQKVIEQFKRTRDEQSEEVKKHRKVIEELQKTLGAADLGVLKDRNVATIDQYKELRGELTRVEIALLKARPRLEQLRNERGQPVRAMDPEVLKSEVAQVFYQDPRVIQIQDQIEALETRKREVVRRTNNQLDPSVTSVARKIEDFERKKNDRWTQLEPEIRRRVTAPPVDAEIEQTIRAAEADLAALTQEEEALGVKLDKLKVENKKDGGEQFKLECAREDLKQAQEKVNSIDRILSDKEFAAKSPIARFRAQHLAKPTNRPDSNRRLSAMIAAPLGMGLLVLGLFAVLELRGARVSDPDELPTRLNLQVIGVVPPLPLVRHLSHSSNGNGNGNGHGNGHANGEIVSAADFRARRQLDEFVQSLDHLRVALCARRDPWGRDRHCVLITSACGSEGKTTLAAQLAERCVNAGLMTLLIDGDLRNPTLSRMLDAAENPGLINVLRGEVLAEDVVTVISDAGGFHLLPAGTPRMDPSRLLQGDRLGSLLAQARESFDMIIVDAPPVLPVPDALTIGRWTDGAVLAVRYDTSRFPLVEKANRRLAHVGVPVIGAVVNGVKSMESAYGYGGYYAYGSAPNTSSSDPD